MLPERSSAVCLLFLSLVTVIPGGGAQYQMVREDPFAQGRERELPPQKEHSTKSVIITSVDSVLGIPYRVITPRGAKPCRLL